VLSGYITTLKIKQKLDVSSEGPSSRVSSGQAYSLRNDFGVTLKKNSSIGRGVVKWNYPSCTGMKMS
jgi:hypothetical protein